MFTMLKLCFLFLFHFIRSSSRLHALMWSVWTYTYRRWLPIEKKKKKIHDYMELQWNRCQVTGRVDPSEAFKVTKDLPIMPRKARTSWPSRDPFLSTEKTITLFSCITPAATPVNIPRKSWPCHILFCPTRGKDWNKKILCYNPSLNFYLFKSSKFRFTQKRQVSLLVGHRARKMRADTPRGTGSKRPRVTVGQLWHLAGNSTVQSQ